MILRVALRVWNWVFRRKAEAPEPDFFQRLLNGRIEEAKGKYEIEIRSGKSTTTANRMNPIEGVWREALDDRLPERTPTPAEVAEDEANMVKDSDLPS